MREVPILVGFLTVILLSGCGGESSSTRNSPSVGSYFGQQTMTISTALDSVTNTEAIQIYIRDDGNVFIADRIGIFGSTILNGNRIDFVTPARVLADESGCEGTIDLSVHVEGESMIGAWSSDSVACGDKSVVVSGTISAMRASKAADVSQVLENASTLVRNAIQQVTG